MPFFRKRVVANRAALILAGGDGIRLRDLTRFITGSNAPKQFCPVIGDSTLLDQTRNRVAALIPPNRTAIVVNRMHRGFYAPLLNDLPHHCLVEQAANRGTATAILYGLRRLAHLGADTTVAIFPSDHFVGDNARFMSHVEEAILAVEEVPARTVILGIAPRCAETAYGWIEPSAAEAASRPKLFRVRKFWEKPRPELAVCFWRSGFLWNSFVVVGRVYRMLEMIRACAPRLFDSFECAFSSSGNKSEEQIADDVYRNLPSVGFSEEVLARCPSNLMVERVDDVEWNDLGEADRVLQTLRTIGHEPNWVRPSLYERSNRKSDYFASLLRSKSLFQ